MRIAPHKVIGAIALSVIVILLLWAGVASVDRSPWGPPLKLSIAVAPAIYSGLIAVADEKNYFKEAGLDISIQPYPSGLEALRAMCRGDARVATAADVAFSVEVLKDPALRVLASIGTTEGSKIVARKDRGIRTPSDLRGKRIGFSADTVSDYFLYTFLLIENISPNEVTAVNIAPARQVEVLLNGEVDAVSAFEIFAYEATVRLDANGVSWSSQNNLDYHWILAMKDGAVRSAEPLKRLLSALLKAESFVRSDEAEAKRLVARKWGFDPAFVEASWRQTRLEVLFNQSMVNALQNYVQWKLKKAGRTEVPPDVLQYLHTDVMDAVAPELVTLYR
ncbi:MAG: ABC transporter substrate-binding protein [Desulfobacterales bacterium]|jgi:NitT/TauT family transport system substrate-binding protein|nr:ABC transporter substrate-binding protein [Desulfobacterales bacterium]